MATTLTPPHEPTEEHFHASWMDLDGEDDEDNRTADQLLDDFLAEFPSGQTRRNYRRYIAMHIMWLERWQYRDPRSAEARHVKRFEKYLTTQHTPHRGDCVWECAQRPYKDPSLRSARAALKSFYDFLQDERVRGDNPVHRRRGRRDAARATASAIGDKDILVDHEIDTLWRHALDVGPGPALAVGLPIGMALRPEEVLSIRIENFGKRWGSRTVKVKRKNGVWQELDIPYVFEPVLDEYTADRHGGPLILTHGRRRRNTETGELEYGPMAYQTLWDLTKRLAVECEVRPGGERSDDYSPRVGRRSFGSLAATETQRDSKGNEPRTTLDRIATYMNHRSVDTLRNHYNMHRRIHPGTVMRNPLGLDWRKQG